MELVSPSVVYTVHAQQDWYYPCFVIADLCIANFPWFRCDCM